MEKKTRFFRKVLFIFVIFLCCGCGREFPMEKQKKAVFYDICEDFHLPTQLKGFVERRKKEACTFTYKNSKYNYMVVCYGMHPYSGYSIQVEECYQIAEEIYLKTQLIGPQNGEPVMEIETYPYIVIRCGKTEGLCVIES